MRFLSFACQQEDLAAIDPVVATVVSTEYVFQLGFMLVVPVLLVRDGPLAVLFLLSLCV